MVKKCKVILRSGGLVVVDFDGIKVQLTDKSYPNNVYVSFYEGKYSISNKSEYENSLNATKKKVRIEKDILDN